MWPNAPTVRLESHYGNRIIRCYANRPRSVDELLVRAATDCPNAVAYVDAGRRRTYAELNATADAVAGGLVARGVRPGDRVATLLDNRGEFAEAFFGIVRAGAIAVPLNIRDQGPEIEHRIAHAQATLLIHESHLADRLPDARATPAVRHRICVGLPVAGSEPFETLVDAKRPQLSPVAEDATAAILYTSGTTGRPKGAMLTNLSIVTSTMNYEYCWELTGKHRALMAVPVSHVTGLVAIMLTMVRVYGTTIFMRNFKAARFLELASVERMTYTLMVPAMYNLCLLQTNFSTFGLSHWRVGGYGGAAMPPATIAQLAAKMPWLHLVNAYGATETTSPSTLMPVGLGVLNAKTVGMPVPTADVVILDDDAREVAVGASGDVWIRGAHVVPGYWRDNAATQESFKSGFWNSGDVGAMTDTGYLRLLDRKKDLINRGGYKVYSAEVEGVLMEHPQVAEAALISVPDPVLGEKSHAVVHAMTSTLSTSDLRRFCEERLSDYKVPDFFSFADRPLPRNPAGKILKRELARVLVDPARAAVASDESE
jgi:acyl-CoA synthetase (AMP-forming)/AMP-acid ligase II